MLQLIYYNYTQVGGNDLQNLVKKCNGLNVPVTTTASITTTVPVTGDYVLDENFTIDINDEQQKTEHEEYKKLSEAEAYFLLEHLNDAKKNKDEFNQLEIVEAFENIRSFYRMDFFND